MKIVVLFLIAVNIGNSVAFKIPQLNSDAVIRQFFEMLKYYIRNGYAEEGLPAMDPAAFNSYDFEIDLPDKSFNLYAAFENMTITGLGYFDIQDSQFIKDDKAVNLKITFPKITVQSERYAMEGEIYEFIPLKGEGKFEFELNNLMFSGKVFLKQSDDEKSILFDKIAYPQFSIQKIISHVEFDGNIDDIANEIITDLLAAYITRFNQYIIKNHVEDLINLLNPFLNNFDSWRLLAAIL